MSLIELLTESTSSSSEEDNGEIVLLKRQRRRIRDACDPLALDDFCFIQYFRLPKATFADLLKEIEPKLKVSVRTTSVPNILKLSSVLRFFAQGSYQTSVGNDFNVGVAQPTVSLIFKEILNVLEEYLCPKWINFNYTEEEKSRAKLYFYEKSGFPGVIGAVDGTHIKIRAPIKNIQHLYYNRKGSFSLNTMIVCDHNQTIRYINGKHPGATHDALIWNLSPLKAKMEADYEREGRSTWLIGDSGYPLSPYLITPFRNVEENSAESRFNKKHTQARIIIERTIGILKNRFRCLLGARELHYAPEKATQIINVCAALHNICVAYKVSFDENFENNEDGENEMPDNEIEISNVHNGEYIRQRILNSL